VTVPFTFSYYDQNGQNDIAWAQFILMDAAGNGHCYGDWGRDASYGGVLDLYDSGMGPTYGFGVNQNDSFCTVSLVSIANSNSDPTLVTVVLNFSFTAGNNGTYLAETQVNYVSGYEGSWESVGTFTLESTPTVQLTDLTQASGSYLAGDSFAVSVCGPANQQVSVATNGAGPSAISSDTGSFSTDSLGNWVKHGTWSSGDINSYVETWYAGGVAATPVLSFSVQARPAPTVQVGNPSYPGVTSFVVGEQYAYQVTGEPGVPVVLIAQQTTYNAAVINSTVSLGQINAQGGFQFQSIWGIGDLGVWSVTVTVGGVTASPSPIVFTVNAASCR
jgi:hypothetical protein